LKKQNGENEYYVLDSSAFLALFEDENGAETVQNLLDQATRGGVIIFVSFVTFTEIFYITFREKGEKEARKQTKLMNRLAITRVESSQELGLKATNKISFADAWIAATAIFYAATLVH